MSKRYIAIFVLLTLLSQQVMAGIVDSSMVAHMGAVASHMTDMDHHAELPLDQTLPCHDSMGSLFDSPQLDCCEVECGTCVGCSLSAVPSLQMELLVISISPANLGYTSNPQSKTPSTPFRPPIFT